MRCVTSGKTDVDIFQCQLLKTPRQLGNRFTLKHPSFSHTCQAATERIAIAEFTQRQSLFSPCHTHIVEAALIRKGLGLRSPATVQQHDMTKLKPLGRMHSPKIEAFSGLLA